MDTRASSTVAIGSVRLTHGQNTGRITGTTPMMSTSPTLTTVITCSNAGIPKSDYDQHLEVAVYPMQLREESHFASCTS